MERACCLLVLLAGGCTQVFGLDPPIAAGAASDGGLDIDMPDASSCIGLGFLQRCYDPGTEPTMARTYTGGSSGINTDGAMCTVVSQIGGPDLCAIEATTIDISGTMYAIGSRPLLLVATDTITITGSLVGYLSLDKGSGAGADPEICPAAGNGMGTSGTGAGGAGGSLGTLGGHGGAGNNVLPGQPVASARQAVLAGGCPGGTGGTSTSTGTRAGSGGGAVYVLARNAIQIASGSILVPGEGGKGGNSGQGGGGGGSGGMIVLDAPRLMIAAGAALVASGGGGGGGGGMSGGGGDGGVTTTATAAAAAGTSNGGGVGGTGSLGASVGGDGTASTSGGGGGGGGAGAILYFATTVDDQGASSPPAIRN